MIARSIRRALVAAVALVAGGQSPARADAVSDFYRGRTVNLVIGYAPDGGYDLYARCHHEGRGLLGRRQAPGPRSPPALIREVYATPPAIVRVWINSARPASTDVPSGARANFPPIASAVYRCAEGRPLSLLKIQFGATIEGRDKQHRPRPSYAARRS